jgi:hypothetical protein
MARDVHYRHVVGQPQLERENLRVRADQAGGAMDAQRRDSVPAIVGDGR